MDDIKTPGQIDKVFPGPRVNLVIANTTSNGVVTCIPSKVVVTSTSKQKIITTGLPIASPDGTPFRTLMFPLQTVPLKQIARDKLSVKGLRGNARDPTTLQPTECKR